MIIKNYAFISYANIKCRSLTRGKKNNKIRTGGPIHVTHETQTKIIIVLTIENKMKWNKMNNIDNTKNNNNDGNNDNKTIIMMILLMKIIVIILIMKTVSQNNWNRNCINKTRNLLSFQLTINEILH